MQCTNNLKQIGLASLRHEQAQGFLPTGGWGRLGGRAEAWFRQRQPGGFFYNILPYMELGALHDMGINEGLDPNNPRTVRPAFLTRVSTPIATIICPSHARSWFGQPRSSAGRVRHGPM